ncbi:RNA polymerase II transcription factor SIII subunit A-domain-containing protein [Xylariomycetidae sp. FL2044]|nr:RNA polymerase II transcription factor SIII subunit A-domain-containing protein [Xylariomycetidae sp. FL2044]
MVKSLVELCTLACVRNVKDIHDLGAMPYDLARPILMKVEKASQLRELEIASPHLQEEDGEIWQRFIHRDFPVLDKKHMYTPKNPASWHRIYYKYQAMEDEQKREAEERLKAAFAGIKKEKQANVSQVMNYDRRLLPRPPRDGRGLILPGSRSNLFGRPDDTTGLRFTGGSRTNTSSGQSIMRKARREAREITARNRLSTPTGRLPVQRGQIMRAPAAMVQEHIVSSQPDVPRAPRLIPGRSVDPEQRKREERLIKIKKEGDAPKRDVTYLSDDQLDDQPDDELFGEEDDPNYQVGGLSIAMLEEVGRSGRSARSDEDSEPAPVQQAKPAPLPQSGGILSRKPPTMNARVPSKITRVATTVGASPSSATPTPKTAASSASPPPRPASSGGGSSKFSPPPPHSESTGTPPGSQPQQQLPRKRKAVDIFMKPKPKGPRHH